MIAPKKLLNHVIGATTSSFVVGLFFMQALQEGLRGDPLVFVFALCAIIFSVVAFVHSRRILIGNTPPG